GTGAPHGQSLDTAAARRLGLPTGPTRSFPPGDAVMDSLLKLKGYRVTQYVADTLIVQGDSQTIFLRGESFVDRQGTKLEADSIRYREASCRLDAAGDPRLFDQGTVLVGEGMRYDTCIRRGTVRSALTTFQQGGATWYTRGDLAVDSGSTRVYGASSEITSSDLPVPDYHFAAHEVKWLNKNVMVARPAVLYIRDVPILWLPFIFQDIRPGRRSGLFEPDALQCEHRLRHERERHSDQRRGSLRRDGAAHLTGELRQAVRLGHPQRRRQPVAEPGQRSGQPELPTREPHPVPREHHAVDHVVPGVLVQQRPDLSRGADVPARPR